MAILVMTKNKKNDRDWSKIDAAHARRGELLTVVFDPSGAAFGPPPKSGCRGAPRHYSDELIEALITVKLMTRLSLRAIEGFARGLARIAGGVSWQIPDYSTLSRRERTLTVDLAAAPREKRRVLVVDSTGLKVFGEGEWKVRVHGTGGNRRTWRKVHLLVDRETGHIIEVKTTAANVHDCTVLPALLPVDLKGDYVLGDGAYHTQPLHRLVHARGGCYRTPPPRDARVWKPYHWKSAEHAFRWRNAELTRLQRLGRSQWKIATGLSQRSFVESTNRRFKTITGDKLSARTLDRQRVEVRLRCKALNVTALSTWSAPV